MRFIDTKKVCASYKVRKQAITIVIVTLFILTSSGCVPTPTKPEGSPGTVKWAFDLSTNISDEISPAILEDGTIYVVAGWKLHAIVDQGNEGVVKSGDWPFGGTISYAPSCLSDDAKEGLQSVSRKITGVPVIDLAQRVYVSAFVTETWWEDEDNSGKCELPEWNYKRYNVLFALNEDGSIAWSIPNTPFDAGAFDFDLMYPPASGIDGISYGVTQDKLYKFSLSGEILASRNIGFVGGASNTPSIAPDGQLYIAYGDNLYKVDTRSNNSNSWQVGPHFEADQSITSLLTVDENATVYFAAGNHLYSVESNLTSVKWHKHVPGRHWRNPVIGEDGNLYVAIKEGALWVYNKETGDDQWNHPGDGAEFVETPLIGRGNGYIYIGASNGKVWFFDPAIQADVASPSPGDNNKIVRGSPAISRDGTLYVGKDDNVLYAINTDSTGLANTRWPMYRRNLYHWNGVRELDGGNGDTWSSAYSKVFTRSQDLDLMREYRDEYLIKRSNTGRIYVARIYQHAPEILNILNENPELLDNAKTLVDKNAQAIQAVLNGQAGVIQNTDEVASFLDRVSEKAPEDLKNLITDLRRHIEKSRSSQETFLGLELK